VVSGDNINSNFSQLSNKKNNLILGDHVWCGAGSFIMNGTNVGVGSIIGAECVLKGSYPNNVTISGNPAKTVRINCAWSRNMDAPNIESINSSYVSQTSETNSPIAGQNVLVIGGTGFSGIRLVQRLIELGNRVTIATRGHKQDVYGYNVNRIILDVTDFDSVKTALANKEYDVVFDDLAYNPLNVYNVLSNVKTKKYVQLSSVMAYGKFHKELDEAELDLDSININLNDWTYEKRKQMNPRELYAKGKRYAEAMAYKISKVPVITVRIPYVFDARPKYYCLHIANDTPMAVKDINKSVVFVRDIDVGNFLPWIAAQDYSGPINFADYGSISIKQIIDYIANKTGKKRIKYGGNDVEPFNEYGESSYSLSLNQINRLGYKGVDVNEWFWGSIDNYIKDATAEVQKVELKSVQPVIIPQIKTGKYANFVNKTGWSGYEKTMLALEGAKCTGCSSCANVCPQNAIRITTDDRGFIVPEIDTNICVNCGLCHKTCPKLNLEFPYPVQSTCYAFMASDELRRVSASGGAFLSCAEYVLDNGGVVFGAAWTEDYGLKHIAVTDKSQLNKIYGSKYLQSSINYAFRTVKDYLLKGKIVLFVGTPCQVDGLRHYLRKDYQNLYTIDLLCRGVPSEELFKRYLKESYGNEKIRSIVQKSKKKLGWGAYTEIIRESGAVENYNMENNIWMKAFLSDFMFRDSCYGCPYPQRKRIGDISMGDFWQIAKYNKSFDDRLGTSFVITNTAKGEALIKSVKSKLLKKVPVEFELPYNSAISSARKVPGNRTLFFDMLQKAPLGAALDRALYGKKYDIGIVGWWSNLNYGGALTYFALYTTVQRLGYSVMMIRPPFSDASMPRTDTVPMRFACKHYVISRLYAHRDMHLLNYACKGFISGSDQLWNPYLEQYAGKECFLSFANQNSLRISYASSFGNVSSFKDNFIAKYKPELKKFDAISVREDYAVELGKKYFDIDAQFVCDPVFLCNRQDYEELAKCSSCGFPGKFILGFILDPNPDKTKAISYITEKKGIGYACFTDLQNVEQRKVAFNLTNVYANHAVEDLIKAYSQCDFVLTDSFHGTCFAIIFNKPFISIKNHERGEKRFESLLRWTGLTNRMVDSVDEIYKRVDLLGSIDYNEVNERVSQFKTKSLEWLKGALKKMKY
ncbi:MAG: polysaccharide pyruvyl transferase family protein, partial [Prevotella sp.]|nr:polysaccharide pyruvyl transferase family protein [Prevotella sp.]